MQSSRTESVAREIPVHLEGLGKEYGHFTALKSLDLTVPQGTSLGFLGPNGAGNSTTIKIMTNLIRPSRGRADLGPGCGGHGGGPQCDQIAYGRGPDDLHELPPPRRGPGGVR